MRLRRGKGEERDARAFGMPFCPAVEAILTMKPRSPEGRGSCDIICLMAYFIPRKQPRVLTLCPDGQILSRQLWVEDEVTISFSKTSRGSVSMVFGPIQVPALLIILIPFSAGYGDI